MAMNAVAANSPALDGSMPVSKTWTLEQLLAMDHDEILALWRTLPTATLEELDGHYQGLTPNAGDPAQQASTAEYLFNENSPRGYWLGKAFKKTGPNAGEGYNRWRFPGGAIKRSLRFTTEVGTSLIDGKPALMMYYGAFNSNITLVDEVRKLDEYIYVGLGAIEAEGGGRSDTPGHFILIGPQDPWVGDAKGELDPKFVKPTR